MFTPYYKYMEQIIYERPREKLKSRGATALSRAELFQLILGSGSGKVPVARLARSVAQLFNGQAEVTYAVLAEVPGLGDAKVCQLIAVNELVRRQVGVGRVSEKVDIVSLSAVWLQPIRQASRLTLGYCSLDGSKNIVKIRHQKINPKVPATQLVRRIFADMIKDDAASCIIGFGSKKYDLIPDMHSLNVIEAIKATASSLDTPVLSITLVNNEAVRAYV